MKLELNAQEIDLLYEAIQRNIAHKIKAKDEIGDMDLCDILDKEINTLAEIIDKIQLRPKE